MRAVLYTDDMEPITVLDVGQWALDMIKQHGYVRFAPSQPVSPEVLTDAAALMFTPPPQVTVYGEWFVRHGGRHLMLFTKDEENALLLKSVFLPGQQRAVNKEKARAFARGFLHALAR